MGNQRQQLKNGIAETLRIKIDNTQALLEKLKIDQHSTQNICVQSKAQIEDAVDRITEQLIQRKTALINEVNLLSQTHLTNLQTNIQNTYQVLGNLQSTLSNLDSFDNSQLLKLQIPEAVIQHDVKVPFCLELNSDYEQVSERIGNWGYVASPISNSDNDTRPVLEPELRQTSIAATEPGLQIETTDTLMNKWLADDQKRGSPALFPYGWQNVLETKNWLWGKLDCEGDGDDDFEVLMDHGVDLRVRHDSSFTVPDVDDKESVSVASVTDDSSSIVCASVPEDFEDKADDDDDNVLSMWLKRRKSSNTSTQTGITEPPALFPPEMFQSTKTSTVSSKSRFLDFPGLRLDPRCWLQKEPIAQFSAEIATNMGGKEIIPPSYAALPYPFWLKKC